MSKRHHPKITKAMVDIIIAVHRRIDLLEECLDALPEAFPDSKYKVIIFDNATPVNEKRQFYAKLRRQSEIYTIIENPENVGFVKACNRAAKRSDSPLIFLLNSDVIMLPNSGELLIKDLDDPQIGIVGMKLLFPDDCGMLNKDIRPAGKVQHVGLATNISGNIIHPLIGWDANSQRVNAVRIVLGVTGAALMTRRYLWEDINGLHEGYGLGCYEDCDFCMEVQRMKYTVVVNTQAVGYHYTGATAETYKIPYPLNHNRMLFLQRWGNALPWSESTIW